MAGYGAADRSTPAPPARTREPPLSRPRRSGRPAGRHQARHSGEQARRPGERAGRSGEPAARGPAPTLRPDRLVAGGRRRRSRKGRSGARPLIAIAVTLGASALAVGTGLALDRLVLPQLRSEPIAASDRGGTPTGAGPSTGRNQLDTRPGPGRGARTAPADAPGAGVETPAPRAAPSSPSSTPPKAKTPPSTQDGDPPADGPTAAPGASGAASAVVALTNAERAKAGCKPLRVDQRLATAARRHSADMAAHGYFDHDSLDGDSPWTRMLDAGYPSPGAENIARGYATAAAVVGGWMDSPGHRANLLNCGLRAIGVGMAAGPDGPLWTQDFGWT
ncbi:CAP domain-containing protein [Actinomadura verrucosospora]|uniref:Membrane-anchored protein n=1 Tax=Actinomadura verrucosospora TaxID=46165 RepID=A0A7D3VWE9_ACTVE|nr:CAP domain-containing protein [Actinomadura verrucosospora]QKG24873.1 membrane-anchored protein [Actinomadura verrucosospora]